MGTEDVKTKAEAWWDWTAATPREYPQDDAPDTEKKTYLNELVQRCLLIDSLSPVVTAQVLVAALNQFGTVQAVKFLKSPLTSKQCVGVAIVEMEKPEDAKTLESLMQEFLFMIGGLPRPARAVFATASMLVDHPFKLKKSVDVRIVRREDVDAAFVFSKRDKFEQHDFEASILYQAQRASEEALANKQEMQYLELKRKFVELAENSDLADIREAYRKKNLLRPRLC